jgi:hypothetical protein
MLCLSLFFLFLLVTPAYCSSDGVAHIPSPDTGISPHVTIPNVFAVTLHSIVSPSPTLAQFLNKAINVLAKVTVENLVQQSWQVTLVWVVTEYGLTNILSHGSHNMSVSYPANATVTTSIPFVLQLQDQIPRLDKLYVFTVEIQYDQGTILKTQQLSTIFTLDDSTFKQQLLYLAIIVIFISIIVVAIYVLRATRKPAQD